MERRTGEAREALWQQNPIHKDSCPTANPACAASIATCLGGEAFRSSRSAAAQCVHGKSPASAVMNWRACQCWLGHLGMRRRDQEARESLERWEDSSTKHDSDVCEGGFGLAHTK